MKTAELKHEIFAGEIDVLKIDVLTQIRKKVNKTKIAELAASIKRRGIIHPLTLRPGAKGRYILVCGERRLIASKQIGKKTVISRVLNLDAGEAVLYQADENLYREDLSPIEEAVGFKNLLDARKYSIEELASVIGKSPAYVTRAVRLLELPKEVIADLQDEKITPAHAHQLLRAPDKDRLEVYENWKNDFTGNGSQNELNGNANSLRESVEEHCGTSLKIASFTKTKPYAGAVACTGCPSNSSNQGDLFGSETEKSTCYYKPCFDKKTKTAGTDEISAFQKKYSGAKVFRVKHYMYTGSNVRGFIIRKKLNKKVPKSDFAIVLYRIGDEPWLATPSSPKEVKKQKANTQQNQTHQDPELHKREQEIRKRVDILVRGKLKKASITQAISILERSFKRGWFDRNDFIKTLKVDVKSVRKDVVTEFKKKKKKK